MARKKQSIPPFLCPEEHSEKFVMFPPDLFENEAYNELTYQARQLYLVMAMNTTTQEEQRVCRAVLDWYIQIGVIEDMTEDAKVIKTGGMYQGIYHNAEWFIFRQVDAERKGFPTRSRTDAYKKELCEKGFIKVICQGKGRMSSGKDGTKKFSKNATLYAFSNKWKS